MTQATTQPSPIPAAPAATERADARPLFVVGNLTTESSGVARIVTSIANTFARRGFCAPIYSVQSPGMEPAAHLMDHPDRCIALPGRWMGRLSYSRQLRHRLANDINDYDVVHHHSLWTLPNRYASDAARRVGKPVMFTAHGALEPWAVSRSAWKKKLVWRWFQGRDLKQAACIQVNSQPEARGIRQLGLTNPIPIIPNGVDLEPFHEHHADFLRDRFPELQGKRIALFLSRLHKKKGLDHLVEAWARLAADHPDWQLVIVGPDDGHEAITRQAVADLGITAKVTFVGPLAGDDKAAALTHADAFLLPSFSEGFSMAILEALAARLPVLITPGCNFDEIRRAGAGLIASPDADATEKTIRDLLAMSDAERQDMGRRARQLVEGGYTWDRVADQLMAVYRWMIHGGDRPANVEWYDG